MGTLGTLHQDVGQTFSGGDTNYLKGDSDLLLSTVAGNAAQVVIRAFPASFGAAKDYLLYSDPEIKFLNIYCDGSDSNKLKVDWYPDATIATQDTGVVCPTDWFTVAVAINNDGTSAKIEIESRLKGQSNWEAVSTNTLASKSLSFTTTASKFVHIGKNFTGTIHSVEITTSDGNLAIDKNAINGGSL